MSHQILLSQLKEKIAAEAHYNIAAIFDQKNNGCWETIAVESYQNIAVRSCPDTNCCRNLPKMLLRELPRENWYKIATKYCFENCPEKMLHCGIDQSKCWTSAEAHQKFAHVYDNCRGGSRAAEKLRRTISSNKDFQNYRVCNHLTFTGIVHGSTWGVPTSLDLLAIFFSYKTLTV